MQEFATEISWAVPYDSPRRTTIGGVAFDRMTESGAVAHVVRNINRGTGGLLLTPNVDILRQLQDERHRDIAKRAALVVADGAPIVWASRLLGDPLPERVTGSSLIRSLPCAAELHGFRVMLLGAAPGVAERAAERLEREHPGLGPIAWYSPPFGSLGTQAGIERTAAAVSRAKPDIVFVGLGFPKQERLALHLLDAHPGTFFVGCGGSITMVAGDTPRAPMWMQTAGLEWSHRLFLEPRRLARRYLVDDAPYAARLLLRALLHRLAGANGPAQNETAHEEAALEATRSPLHVA